MTLPNNEEFVEMSFTIWALISIKNFTITSPYLLMISNKIKKQKFES
jgi:hypothetical protein